MPETIKTRLTELLGIKYPILLAGMNAVAHSDLVAAVSNAGGLGTIGGLTFTPEMLKEQIDDAKELMTEKKNPKFGVDLAIPQLGGNARKTNHDYSHGKLPELIDIIIAEGASLFVCAVGVPPAWAVDKLHAAGIPVMNMIGHPRHVEKALAMGVDIICAQGTEGGGHTGDVATTILMPEVVDQCRGRKSPLTGEDVLVIGAGGIFDGRGLAASLSYGADGVWVGTRFVAAEEAASPARHKKGLVEAGVTDTTRTLIYSGRPLRTLITPYVKDWHDNRAEEITALCAKGTVPFSADMKAKEAAGTPLDIVDVYPLLMGQAAGAIKSVETAETIINDMMSVAIASLRRNTGMIARL